MINDISGIISLANLQISELKLGGSDVVIYIGMQRIWPQELLTNFVDENDVQFVTENSTDNNITRIHYDTIYYEK